MKISLSWRKGAFPVFIFVAAWNLSSSSVSAADSRSLAIDYVTTEKFMVGYPDGQFHPMDPINRAQIAKVLSLAFASPSSQQRCVGQKSPPQFPDVPEETWYSTFLCIAVHEQWVSGYPDGSFKPDKVLSFAEIAKMSALASRTGGAVIVSNPGEPWYIPFVRVLSGQSAIPASITTFEKQVTRGEVAEMIWRLKTQATAQPVATLDIFKDPQNLTIRLGESSFFTSIAMVFYDSLKIEGAEPKSFRLAPKSGGAPTFSYAIDQARCYFRHIPIIGCNPRSLVELTGYYAKDAKHAFYSQHYLDGVDVASFRAFGQWVFDRSSLYDHAGKAVLAIDGPSFTSTGNYYGRDKNRGYFWGPGQSQAFAISGSHGASFVGLTEDYAHDKNLGYYKGERIDGSDGKTFANVKDEEKIANLDYAKDRNSVYLGKRNISSDPMHFAIVPVGKNHEKVLKICAEQKKVSCKDDIALRALFGDVSPLARDSTYVYCDGDVISDDPEHFIFVDEPYAKDSQYWYNIRACKKGSPPPQ